jgi:predicted acylesterase/phospholipase RssA
MLDSPAYVDLAPVPIGARLLDGGIYACFTLSVTRHLDDVCMSSVGQHLARLRESSTDALEHAYAQLDALENAIRAERLQVLAVLDERGVGRADGCPNTADWVAMTSRGRCAAWCATARCRPSSPTRWAVRWGSAQAPHRVATARAGVTTPGSALPLSRL